MNGGEWAIVIATLLDQSWRFKRRSLLRAGESLSASNSNIPHAHGYASGDIIARTCTGIKRCSNRILRQEQRIEGNCFGVEELYRPLKSTD